MKPFGAAPSDVQSAEAAPARARIRVLAIAVFAALLLLSGRAVQLAFAGDPLAAPRGEAAAAGAPRADIVDRNGVLLATTVRAYALTAAPQRVWNAAETADALRRLFPDLDRAAAIRRLTDASRQLVYLRRGLTAEERGRVHELGLAGIGFEAEHRRAYPQGALAAHALGFTDIDLNPLAGVEYALSRRIRAAGAGGRPLELTLDVRIQHAIEVELDAAARASQASGGAAIMLDGRSGEVLALASWPSFDPNRAGDASSEARRDRVVGDVHELGSSIKPFTVAMALQERVASAAESFELGQPFAIEDSIIADRELIAGPASLREALARSSNVAAARLALRVGGARQRAYFQRLGLTHATALQVSRNPAPIYPAARGRRDVAGLGFGYGLAASPAALAGAYTVFVNAGERVSPTLVSRPAERVRVFSPEVTGEVLGYLRAAVESGTGRAADVPGLEVAGKTGTAEKFETGAGYAEGRNFSSFAAVFPAREPHYVIVLALDDAGAGAAGGVVAAPAVARTLRRVAPMLGLRVEADAAAR